MPKHCDCATIRIYLNHMNDKWNYLVFLRFKSFVSIVLAVVFAAAFVVAQNPSVKVEKKEEPKPVATPRSTPNLKEGAKPFTADQVADSSIFIYGFGGGRTTLKQIRKTTFERGKTTLIAADGKVEQTSYQRWIIRADTLGKEKIRLDQEFTNARYALVFNDEKIFGVYNNTVFSPREEAIKGFENSIFHGFEALFRFKENESKLELAGREKQMGVEYYMLDVTDKKDRKTRFYISVKTLRILMLTYEEAGVKYRRRFYDQKYAQGTLVPYRSVLTANDKIVEESEISSITFGQKVDEDLFKGN